VVRLCCQVMTMGHAVRCGATNGTALCKAIACANKMHVKRKSKHYMHTYRPAVDVLPNALELCRVAEVGAADGLAHNIPVAATGRQRQLLLLHDVQQLRTNLCVRGGVQQDSSTASVSRGSTAARRVAVQHYGSTSCGSTAGVGVSYLMSSRTPAAASAAS
jgi:hypothetical protein